MVNFFRVQVSHPEDTEKTRIRMNKTHMQELGIQKGDIVKITGGRTTYAFCLPLDDDYDRKNEKNFVFLDESGKNMPIIKVGNLTYSNLLNFHFGNLVQVEKSSAVKASKILVKPLYAKAQTGKKDYALDWLEGQVIVSRGDRIVGRRDDPKNIPGFFVIGGTPDSNAWIIDRDTPIEISDDIPENLHHMILSGGNLTGVIPVVQKIQGGDFEATLAAIESYDNCMKLIMYVKDILVYGEEWTSGVCTPTIRAWDDLGNQYALNRFGMRGGGTQFGGSLWGESRYHFSEIACILTPALDAKSHALTISIEQLLWDIRKRPMVPPRVIPGENGPANVMTPMVPIDEKFVIHGGPWEFKIGLGEK
ncbi:MAG TPA: hypothetical protein VFX64_03765 [Candidatus Nitrosotalea sp.]|nr:hypothetical protein [Candidatus Nitrosotalea sp.]